MSGGRRRLVDCKNANKRVKIKIKIKILSRPHNAQSVESDFDFVVSTISCYAYNVSSGIFKKIIDYIYITSKGLENGGPSKMASILCK